MPDIRAIEEAVRSLEPTDLAAFRQWFVEFDSVGWDRQIEDDLSSGKLDRLLEEADQDHRMPTLRPL
jgi:hypothetical protein